MLELEIGYGLIPLVDESEGGELLDARRLVRRQIAAELGIVLAPIRIRDNVAARLARVRDPHQGRRGRARRARARQPARDGSRRRRPVPRRHPHRRAGLRPARRLDRRVRAPSAEALGYTVVDPRR